MPLNYFQKGQKKYKIKIFKKKRNKCLHYERKMIDFSRIDDSLKFKLLKLKGNHVRVAIDEKRLNVWYRRVNNRSVCCHCLQRLVCIRRYRWYSKGQNCASNYYKDTVINHGLANRFHPLIATSRLNAFTLYFKRIKNSCRRNTNNNNSYLNLNFYILIREGIRFMQNEPPPPVFVKCPRFETP